jgi:uncharacterized protein
MIRAAVVAALLAFPAFTAPVVDQARVVPDNVEQTVDAQLVDYQQRTGNQIAVAVVDTTGKQSLENYSIDLAREWGVGQKGKDNGVLLLIAVKDRKIRIEVGRGLEGNLTDLQSGRIINDVLLPRLRAGDYGGAVAEGTQAIRATLGDPAATAPPPVAAPTTPGRGEGGSTAAFFGVVLVVVLFLLVFGRRRRGRRMGLGMPIFWGSGWGGGFGGGGGGGGGGGFGGGGGGGFGGGGASGGW